MPTIITAHIANMKAKSAGAQALMVGAIGPAIALMSMPGMSSMPVMPSAAICAVSQSRYAQARSITTINAAATVRRSRLSSVASQASISRISVDDTVLTEMQFGELPVGIGEVD